MANLLLPRRGSLAGAVRRLHLGHMLLFLIFPYVSQSQFLRHILHQQQALSRHRTQVGRGLFLRGGRKLGVLPELVGRWVIGLFGSHGMVELTFGSVCTFFSWKKRNKTWWLGGGVTVWNKFNQISQNSSQPSWFSIFVWKINNRNYLVVCLHLLILL